MAREYDAFISYCSADGLQAEHLYQLLSQTFGLRVWFDRQDVIPGTSFVRAIEDGLSRSLTCLALIGECGEGPWQRREIEIALQRQTKTPHFRLIPVFLPGAPSDVALSGFLTNSRYVDLRTDPIGNLAALMHGIKGQTGVALYMQPSAEDSEEVDPRVLPSGYTADVAKIVELLVGESLYARRDVCVRELIQNACDACERRRLSLRYAYRPEICVRTNGEGHWFEVADNGEGMNPSLLLTSFAVIGKSIRDEHSILRRLHDDRARLTLIAKFGIGFVSAFIVADRIVVSTTYEGDSQINLLIRGVDERFIYKDASECDRPQDRIGTTVRVYLQEQYHDLAVVSAAKAYLRHVPYCRVEDESGPIEIDEFWNVEGAEFQTYTRKALEFELHWGYSDKEGSFVASNWGFFVCHDPRPVLPFFIPNWIVGEIDVYPGVVDLSLSLDAIVDSPKATRLKRTLCQHLADYLKVLAKKALADEVAQSPKEERDRRTMRSRLEALCLVYNYCGRDRKKGGNKWPEDPPLSVAETNELILDLYQVRSEASNTSVSLREALNTLRTRGSNVVYYYLEARSLLRFQVDALRSKGVLVLSSSRWETQLRGSRTGKTEVWDHELFGPLMKDHGFEYRSVESVIDDDELGLTVGEDDLPLELRSVLSTDHVGVDVTLVHLPGADLAFHEREKWYLNTAHTGFDKVLTLANSGAVNDVEAYVRGLFQVPFR